MTPHEHESLFVIAAATLLLVFIGIHNAWDTVTYITLSRSTPRRQNERAHDDAEPAPTVTPPITETST